MRRTILSVLAGTATLMSAVPASAQGADQTMRCFLASNIFTKLEKDPARKQVAIAAFFFYFGRLDAQLSPAQLKAQALAQGKTLNQQNVGPVMTACARQLQAKQQGLQALAQAAAAQAKQGK